MRLDDKAIEELKQIYKEENGKELSDSDALEMGTRLLGLFHIILKPLSKEEFEEYKKMKLCQQKVKEINTKK